MWLNASPAALTISDAPHCIEIDWRAATAPGASDGGMALWIDGNQAADKANVDNDTRRVESVQLGATFGVDSGTSGTYFFDAFESRRQSYIGPVQSGLHPAPAGRLVLSTISAFVGQLQALWRWLVGGLHPGRAGAPAAAPAPAEREDFPPPGGLLPCRRKRCRSPTAATTTPMNSSPGAGKLFR